MAGSWCIKVGTSNSYDSFLYYWTNSETKTCLGPLRYSLYQTIGIHHVRKRNKLPSRCAESHEPQYQAYTHTLCEICYGRPPFFPWHWHWHLCKTWKQDRNRKLLSFATNSEKRTADTCFGTTKRTDFAYSGWIWKCYHRHSRRQRQRQTMIASYQIHPAHAHGKRFNQNAMIL